MYEMEGLKGGRETDWLRADKSRREVSKMSEVGCIGVGELNKCFWQVIIIYDYFFTYFQNLVKMMEELSVAIGIQVMWFYVSDAEK